MAGYGSLRCTVCKEHPKKNKPHTQLRKINGLVYCKICGREHKLLLNPLLGAVQRSKALTGIVVVNPVRSAS